MAGFDGQGAAGGAVQGASMGAVAGPWGALIGAGVGAVAGGFLSKAGKAKAEAKKRQRYLKTLYAEQGNAQKASIQRSATEGNATISQNMIDRGLYNTTALDSAQGLNRAYATQAMNNVDANTADKLAGIELQTQDVGPSLGGLSDMLFSAAKVFGDQREGGKPGQQVKTVDGAGGTPGTNIGDSLQNQGTLSEAAMKYNQTQNMSATEGQSGALSQLFASKADSPADDPAVLESGGSGGLFSAYNRGSAVRKRARARRPTSLAQPVLTGVE